MEITFIVLFKKEPIDIIETAGEYTTIEKAEEMENKLKEKGYNTKIIEWK